MILCAENTNESTKTKPNNNNKKPLLEWINEFIMVTGYKVKTQNSSDRMKTSGCLGPGLGSQ